MMKKFTPKTFTAEEFNAINNASVQQDASMKAPKSSNPDYPVYEVPVNKKELIYVPNMTRVNADGTIDLLRDEALLHPVRQGRSFSYKRCYKGISVGGYTGECPFCDATADSWDLFNLQWKQLLQQKGVDENDPNDPLKEERKKLLSAMALQNAEKWYTFPIVVIECEDGKLKPKLNDDKSLNYKFYWYTCKERTIYQDKWVKGLGNFIDEEGVSPTHPAGLWLVLDYTYTPKDGAKHDKMGSANALQVSVRTMKGYDKVAKMLDEECIKNNWTPAMSSQTVIANYYLDLADVEEYANEVIKPTRDKLLMLQQAQSAVVAGNIQATSSVENAINSFSAQPVQSGVNAGVNAQPTQQAQPDVQAQPQQAQPSVQAQPDASAQQGNGSAPQVALG